MRVSATPNQQEIHHSPLQRITHDIKVPGFHRWRRTPTALGCKTRSRRRRNIDSIPALIEQPSTWPPSPPPWCWSEEIRRTGNGGIFTPGLRPHSLANRRGTRFRVKHRVAAFPTICQHVPSFETGTIPPYSSIAVGNTRGTSDPTTSSSMTPMVSRGICVGGRN